MALTLGSKIFQISMLRLSQLAIFPFMKSTSRLRFLWSSFSMISLRINVLKALRSMTKPVSGSGVPLTVTIISKLCPCQFSLAQGPNTSMFFSLLQLGLYNLWAALKCSLRLTNIMFLKGNQQQRYFILFSYINISNAMFIYSYITGLFKLHVL